MATTPPRVLKGHAAHGFTRSRSVPMASAPSPALWTTTLRVWDLDGHTSPRVLEGHTSWVDAVALSADGKRAVSGSWDDTLRVWDLDGQTPPRVLEGHTELVSALALSADGKRAVSGSMDQTLRVWDLDGQAPPRVLKATPSG